LQIITCKHKLNTLHISVCNKIDLSTSIDCFKTFPNIKEISLYKFNGINNNEITSLANYLMSVYSRNLKTLILPHFSKDFTEFIDFCRVFEHGAINLTTL
jgi:hypothetical protein